jgi:hypothetical protein
MINTIILSVLMTSSTMSTTADVGLAKQNTITATSFSQNEISTLLQDGLLTLDDQVQDEFEAHSEILKFLKDYSMIQTIGYNNLLNDLITKRDNGYYFTPLDGNSGPNGYNGNVTTFGRDLVFPWEPGGGGGEPTIPTALTETQITAQYGQRQANLNGKIGSKNFYGISVNAAACASMYNLMLRTAGTQAIGGVGVVTIILEIIKTQALKPAVTAITSYFSGIIKPFLSLVTAGNPLAVVIAVILAACAFIALVVVCSMVYAGYKGKAFRMGILRNGLFNYTPVYEIY